MEIQGIVRAFRPSGVFMFPLGKKRDRSSPGRADFVLTCSINMVLRPRLVAAMGALVFLPLLVPAQTRSNLKSYTPGAWELDAGLRYFRADGNYSRSGNRSDSLAASSSFDNYELDSGVRNVMADRNLSWFGSIGVAASEAKVPGFTRSNSGLTRVLVGTDFVLYQGAFALIPEFQFVYPMVRNNTNSDTVAIGEGAMELRGRLIAQASYQSSFRASAWLGGAYRDEGRSHLLTYGSAGEFRMAKWFVGGEFIGFTSLTSDRDSSNEGPRIAWQNRANGSAQRFFSINPDLLEANLFLRWQPTRSLGFRLGGGTTLNGASTAAGWSAQAGLVWRLFPDRPLSEVREPMPQEVPPQRFEEKTEDGVDQELFRTNPPPQPPRRRRSSPSVDIQSELNKTEMQIELKKLPAKKKKKRQ